MPRSFKRAVIALVLMLAGVFSAVAIQTPASAAYSNCPAGWACVWSSTGGTGIRVDMSYTWMSPAGTCKQINPGAVGGYKSIYSTVGSGLRIYFYSSTSCGGANLLGSVGLGQSWSSASGGIRAVIMI
jgi:hypothetical protein